MPPLPVAVAAPLPTAFVAPPLPLEVVKWLLVVAEHAAAAATAEERQAVIAKGERRKARG
jgi:hypothetical protein